MVISWMAGQKHYPVKYNIASFFFFVTSALILYFTSEEIRDHFNPGTKQMLIINTVFLLLFLVAAYIYERRKIPYIRIPLKNSG
jgi:hypothetical protein